MRALLRVVVVAATSLLPATVWALSPVEIVPRDDLDLIEVNHFYDECGKHVFDQVIFYEWSEDESRFNIRAWRLLKRPAQTPYKDWRLDCYTATWNDGDVIRTIRSPCFRETWTQHDPELAERQRLAKNERVELYRLYWDVVEKTTKILPKPIRVTIRTWWGAKIEIAVVLRE